MKFFIKIKNIILIISFIIYIKAKEGININEKEFNSKFYDNNNVESEQNTFFLNEGELYFNTILKNELLNYTLNLQKDTVKLEIEIVTFVGDIDIIYYENITYEEDYVTNKIYLVINIDDNILNQYSFGLKALVNSYYTVQATCLTKNSIDLLIQKDLKIGYSHLIIIQDEAKTIKFIREKQDKKAPIMFTFNTLNCIASCEFHYYYGTKLVKENTNKKPPFEHLLNYVIDPNDENDISKFSNAFEFKLDIIDEDACDYERKVCKLYATAYEISDDPGIHNNSILIPDNTNQHFMFRENTRTLSFRYAHVDIGSDIVIKFNPKHKAEYSVIIYYENKLRERNETIIANNILYLSASEWNRDDICKTGARICNIRMDITLIRSVEIDPILEFSIKSLFTKSISYIQKSILRLDYTQNNNSQYYFTELGIEDEGYITVNFKRSYGNIYARIIERKTNDDEYDRDIPRWRGQYVLPNADNGFSMEETTKRLKFSTIDYECLNVCILLISVFPTDSIDLNQTKNYPYSIIVQHKTNEKRINIPVIQIPIDEYIFGNVEKGASEYYAVFLGSDANLVQFDFQSKTACFDVRVGKKKPSENNKDFQFCSKGDSIFNLNRTNIIKISKTESLKGVTLTLRVWAEKTELALSSPYIFSVRLDNDTENDIIRVNSDQKVSCIPKLINQTEKLYRCLFVIEYDFISEQNKLFVYSMTQVKGIVFNLYGRVINQTDYEMNSVENIRQLIPSKDSYNISNKNSIYDFVFLKDGFKDWEYLLLSLEAKSETYSELQFELISAFYCNSQNFAVNPSTPQLFVGYFNQTITLNFPNKKKKLAYLKCLAGSAEVYWDDKVNKQYYIRGKDDILAISSEESDKLNLNPTYSLKDSGFGLIFYIYYNDRPNNNYNIDELLLDNSIYYSYYGKDFPISFFAEIDLLHFGQNDYYEICFSFDTIENEDNFYEYNKKIPFEVIGYIVNEETIEILKKNPELGIDKGLSSLGKYDPGLKTGLIHISKKKIDESFNNYGNPYLYLTIKKEEQFKNQNYKSMALEVNSIYNQPNSYISDLVNIFGKLAEDEKEREYKLRAGELTTQIKIKFSCSNYSLSIRIKDYNNLEFEKEENGRQIYSLNNTEKGKLFYILVISRNETKKDNNSKEQYFWFQYSYSNQENHLFISNSTLDIKRKINESKDLDLIITLNPVENITDQYVNYIVRGIDNNSTEYIPDKEEIILSFDDKQYIREFHNPKLNNESTKIELEISGIPKTIKILQVIAQINDKEKIEFLSYKNVDLEKMGVLIDDVSNKEDDDDDEDTKKFVILLITTGVFLSLIIGVLVYVIRIYQKKTKGLLDQVNKVSFQFDRDSKLNPDANDKNNKMVNDSNDEILLIK